MIVPPSTTEKCDYCGYTLDRTHIVWHLERLSLRLHASCAKTLAYQIRRNALNLEQREASTDLFAL
jgi:hypothetical protein